MAGVALSIPLGGTGQTTAEGARIALGLGPDNNVTFHDLHLTGNLVVDGTITGTFTGDLGAIEALTGTGFAVRIAPDTWALRTFTAPAAGFTITNPAGTAGNPTFVLVNDLAALEALAGTNNIYYRSAVDTWTSVTIGTGLSFSGGTLSNTVAVGNDLTAIEALTGTGVAVRTGTDTWALRSLVAPAAGLTITNPAGVAGDLTFVLANDLNALEGLSTNGLVTRTATDTMTTRTITGSANQIVVTNGDGVSGNPTLAFANTVITHIVERMVTASETYTPDAAVVDVEFEIVAAGGGSGGVDGQGASTVATSGGGGGGEYARLYASGIGVTPWTITIGAAGTAGAAGNNAGGTGGTTTVTDGTTTCTAIGGTGGNGALAAVNAAANGGAGGTGGTGGTANRRVAGQSGGVGYGLGSVAVSSTGQGGSPARFGIGGRGSVHVSPTGTVGSGYGAGASGVSTSGVATNFAGAAGTAGCVLIREFRQD